MTVDIKQRRAVGFDVYDVRIPQFLE